MTFITNQVSLPFSNQTKQTEPQKPTTQPSITDSISTTLDEIKLGERVKETSGKELVTSAFLGGLFGAGAAIPVVGVFENFVPRTANLAPTLLAGAIGAVAAGTTTDNPLHGAAIGAGTSGAILATAGAIIGGPRTALVMGIAGLVGGTIGGGFASMNRGRLVDSPPPTGLGVGLKLMSHSRH